MAKKGAQKLKEISQDSFRIGKLLRSQSLQLTD